MLSIKEFVEESLVQIAEGIQGAQKRVHDMDVKLFPDVFSDKGTMSEIEFDIAVTVVQGSETGDTTEGGISGSLKWGLAVISAGFGGKTDSNYKEEDMTVSRIRFTVQAQIPAAHKGETKPDSATPPKGGKF